VQVVETGPTVSKPARREAAAAPPIVLLHCFGCSLHWWDRMVPLLARRHRVIRIDLLGFGGSAKPKSGYSMEDQGRLVALALGRLDVQGAVVVGHSMGFTVATALAGESSELVDRLVDVDAGADPSFGSLPFLARLASAPVIGQALRRVSPDFAIEDGYSSAFAPGYDLGDFSDQIVDDYRAMTYTSYDRSPAEVDDYQDELALDQRIREAAVPLLVIFGEQDQLYDDPEAAAQAYADVPGARITIIRDAGHSPNVEKPGETAGLVLDFAADASRR
jgi:pimeloyl-ACP methyl ester carboxylesterase